MSELEARSAVEGLAVLGAGVLGGNAESHLYRSILDVLPVAIYVTDAEGLVTYYNRAAGELAGREPEIGREHWCVTWRLYTPDGTPLPHDQCPMAVTLREKRAVRGVEAIAERPDGTRVPFIPYPTPLFSPDGQLIGGVNLLVDISERKAAEAALREQSGEAYRARYRLSSIVESSEDAIASKDLNGIVVSWNRGAEKLFGYTAAEMIGKPITILMPEDRQNEEVGILQRIRSGERVEHFETIRRHKDGRLMDISLTVSPVRDENGTIIGASKIARDITARKQVEMMLARHMDEQAALFRLTDGLHRATTVEDIYAVSLEAIVRALACDRASILLMDETRAMRFVAWRGLSDGYRRVVDGHSPWNAEDKDPQSVCINDVATADLAPELKATVLAEGIRACAFIPLMASDRLIGKFMAYYDRPHAFTESEINVALAVARQLAFGLTRQRAEDDLRANEERLRLATEAGKVGVWEWDVVSDRIAWTDSLYAMHGISREQVEATSGAISEFTHPEDRARLTEAIRKSVATGEPCEVEFRAVRPDGEVVWLFTSVGAVRENGKVVRLLGATIDVTERKQSDAQRDLLVAELSHRVKNTLATVISIAHQSFSKGLSVDEARASFDGRIRALAQTHGRLAEGNWSGVPFETIVGDELAPYRRDDGVNVRASGPQIMLAPKQAVVLGMAFHELATNAAKYGALSNKKGVVDIGWEIKRPESELHIRWAESGGPAVAAPRRSGFGRLLLERALASDLQGTVRLDFAESGLRCDISLPIDGQSAARN